MTEKKRQEEAQKEQLRKEQEVQKAREEKERKEKEAIAARNAAFAIAAQNEAIARQLQKEEEERVKKENKLDFDKLIGAAAMCEICGENALEGQGDEVLSCGHIVHAVCIRQYLSTEIK